MKKIISSMMLAALIIGLSSIISCKQTPKVSATDSVVAVVDTTLNYLTAQEKADGWILMFDGKTTAGWRAYNKPAFPDSGWMVEDGTLRCVGSGQGEAGGKGGDIVFDSTYTDFMLSLEWKISPGGNSGIFYLGMEIPNEPIWKSAPEMQILDDAKHPDALLGKDGNRKAGSLYDLIPSKVAEKPAGEWNKAEIMVYQGTVVHKLNGETAVEYHLGTSDWDKLIKASKFSTFKDFGKIRKGFICLQDHGNDVWFRNVKIKPLQ
jgi:hypothetical protein